jgi:hypothetical protein
MRKPGEGNAPTPGENAHPRENPRNPGKTRNPGLPYRHKYRSSNSTPCFFNNPRNSSWNEACR